MTFIVLVPSIFVLNLLRSLSKSYGWPFLKLDILSLYISDANEAGLHLILTLVVFLAFSTSSLDLIIGIGGG